MRQNLNIVLHDTLIYVQRSEKHSSCFSIFQYILPRFIIYLLSTHMMNASSSRCIYNCVAKYYISFCKKRTVKLSRKLTVCTCALLFMIYSILKMFSLILFAVSKNRLCTLKMFLRPLYMMLNLSRR